MSVELHLVTGDTFAQLLPLVRAYHEFESVELDEETRAAVLRPLLGESTLGRVWLVSIAGEVVGYVAICFGYSIEFAGRDAFVDELFITEAHRGQGIGRDVLARVESEAAALGIRVLHLEVARTNTRAQKLYAAAGFRARERFFLMSRRITVLLVALTFVALLGGGCARDAAQVPRTDGPTTHGPGAVRERRPPPAAAKAFAYDCDDLAFTVRIEGDTAQVLLPDRSVVLPRVPAASGAKYSDGATVFWNKGDAALLEVNGTTYRDCVNNPGRAVWENAKLRGVDFRGLGNEPGWYVEIDDGERITIVTGYGQTRLHTPAPAPEIDPKTARTTYRVRTAAHDLTITIEGKTCRDTMSGEAFSSTVAVTLDERQYHGCGRALH